MLNTKTKQKTLKSKLHYHRLAKSKTKLVIKLNLAKLTIIKHLPIYIQQNLMQLDNSNYYADLTTLQKSYIKRLV